MSRFGKPIMVSTIPIPVGKGIAGRLERRFSLGQEDRQEDRGPLVLTFRTMPPTNRATRILLAGVAALGLALAGCSSSHPAAPTTSASVPAGPPTGPPPPSGPL